MKQQFVDKDNFDLSNSKERDRMYAKFDEHQKNLFHAAQDNIFTFCEANAGTGKTTVAVAAMLDLLAAGKIDKIVYIRVADDRAQSVGYYPGTLEEKTSIYWTPFYQALESLGLQSEAISMMERNEQIETTLDINLRGVNIVKAGIILDEVQNAVDAYTLKLIFTRIDDDSHIIAIGDGKQNDMKKKSNAYKEYCEYLADSRLGTKCELVANFRGKFSKLAENFEPEAVK